MAPTVLGNVVAFFDRLGVYDVVLPFLLVFTVVYGILERSKVFGTQGGNDGEEGSTKKNLNAMVAFVIGFLVVASSKIVEAVSRVSSQMVILLLLGMFFIMAVGFFYKKEEWEKHDLGWPKHAFIALMFVSLIAIFLGAIRLDSGQTWLEFTWNWLAYYWDSAAIASIILIIGIIIFMKYITNEETSSSNGN
ncbi:hypothetical protein CMO91_00745 [Candidatus Woesearchaeota archaeon]|nr:hypothetical protein [Candidatus Woesearchaeota archaeon]